MRSIETEYLHIVRQQLQQMKTRAEQALAQMSDEDLHWRQNSESNSIGIIIQHLSGNMSSRWMNFLETDGEKASRDRKKEFIDQLYTRELLNEEWNKGWRLLFNTIENLQPEDLLGTVTLRTKPLSVISAIQIEVAHISYHVGQILYIGKLIKGKEWKVLSVPKE